MARKNGSPKISGTVPQTTSKEVNIRHFWAAIDLGGSKLAAETGYRNQGAGTITWNQCNQWPGKHEYSPEVPTLVTVARGDLRPGSPRMRWGWDAYQKLRDNAAGYDAYYHIKHILMDTSPLPPHAQAERERAKHCEHDMDDICLFFVTSVLDHLLKDAQETDRIVVFIAVPVHVDDNAATKYLDIFRKACQFECTTFRVADEATASTVDFVFSALGEESKDLPQVGELFTLIDIGSVTMDVATGKRLKDQGLEFIRRESFPCGSGSLNSALRSFCVSNKLLPWEIFLFNETLDAHKANIPSWVDQFPTGPVQIHGDNSCIMTKLEEARKEFERRCWHAIQEHHLAVFENEYCSTPITMFMTGGGARSETLAALFTAKAQSATFKYRVHYGNTSTSRSQHTLAGLKRICDDYRIATPHRLPTDLFICCHDPESKDPVLKPIRLLTKNTNLRNLVKRGQQYDPAFPIVCHLKAIPDPEDDDQCLTISLEMFIPKPGAEIRLVKSQGDTYSSSAEEDLVSLGKHDVRLDLAVEEAYVYVYVQCCMRTAIFGLVYHHDGREDRTIEGLRYDDILRDPLFGGYLIDYYARNFTYTEAARVMLPQHQLKPEEVSRAKKG